MSNIHVRHESRSLRCDLTNTERLERGRALAEADAECARLEEEKGRVASQYAAQLKTATAKRHELASTIRQGYEFRDVTCSVQHIYSDREVSVVRLDTGEVIERRGMNPMELRAAEDRAQGKLFDEPPAPPASPAPLAEEASGSAEPPEATEGTGKREFTLDAAGYYHTSEPAAQGDDGGAEEAEAPPEPATKKRKTQSGERGMPITLVDPEPDYHEPEADPAPEPAPNFRVWRVSTT